MEDQRTVEEIHKEFFDAYPDLRPVRATEVESVTALPQLRDRTDRQPISFMDKVKHVVKSVPSWFYLAPVITFFVSSLSFGTAGV